MNVVWKKNMAYVYKCIVRMYINADYIFRTDHMHLFGNFNFYTEYHTVVYVPCILSIVLSHILQHAGFTGGGFLPSVAFSCWLSGHLQGARGI